MAWATSASPAEMNSARKRAGNEHPGPRHRVAELEYSAKAAGKRLTGT